MQLTTLPAISVNRASSPWNFTACGRCPGRGVLYGTTDAGGSATGTVFQLTPPTSAGGAGTETILHSFTGQDCEGSNPGPLTINADGVLFGTTFSGGAGAGTIFAVEP